MKTCYAIGDVHGEAERLALLHEMIVADHAHEGGDALIVHLGDLVDRGPDSRSVVARVMEMERAPPANASAVCVLGNHESLMLEAAALKSGMAEYAWLSQGGAETVESYEAVNGRRGHWRDAIDGAHLHWLRGLPTLLREGAFVFVHGGIDPKTFPNCTDELRIWTRSEKFFDESKWPKRAELEGILVVHGHTPTDDFAPDIGMRRINVDTGAVFGGPLTCVVLRPGEAPRFLQA